MRREFIRLLSSYAQKSPHYKLSHWQVRCQHSCPYRTIRDELFLFIIVLPTGKYPRESQREWDRAMCDATVRLLQCRGGYL